MTDPDEPVVPELRTWPYPWPFVTRRTARTLVKIIVGQHAVIASQQAAIIRLQSELNKRCCEPGQEAAR